MKIHAEVTGLRGVHWWGRNAARSHAGVGGRGAGGDKRREPGAIARGVGFRGAVGGAGGDGWRRGNVVAVSDPHIGASAAKWVHMEAQVTRQTFCDNDKLRDE